MKRLLVATDLSERSDRAINRAMGLAKGFGAHLTILHVIDEDLPASVADKEREAAHANLQEHLSSLPGAESLDIRPVVDFGKDWAEIIRQAEADRSELIILGTHREQRFEGLFRGTTVERVIRNGDLPVLVVRNRATRAYRSVLVGVDFSIYSKRAVEFAVGFTPKAEIHLVHAYDIPFKGFLTGSETRGEIKKRHQEHFAEMIDQEMSGFLTGLEGGPARLNRVLCEGEPHEVLYRQAHDLKADLLVVGTHGRTGVAHALLGSVAEAFLTDAPCDVAAVKAW